MSSFLDPPPLAIAHRGGAATGDNVGIENSLAAFAHAYALGYRYLETDVRATSDGVVYAIHDARLDRLTGSADAIDALTSESFDLQRLDQREPFARLDALLDAFPDARLMIDVKSDAAVDATCRVLKAHDAVDRACLSTFSHARLRRMRRMLPGVTTSASTLEVVLTRFLPAPLLRLVGVPGGRCLQVPHRHGPLRVVTRRFVRRAHALGQQVHVWTVDDAQEINELLDLGVDGIITDRTDVLKDVLVARGTWRDPA
ncbi:glycerophosphodiester phosphodiesterase [Aeromicrobium sp. SMF47]|uniref:Glycerophosphodiester phosphodiesterase n=1 Tax=Aeromicrobium yanjiei TaxID=2662028 RepID=A0A5Q2MM37_9ACTN|nr:glycerophosphodiester phosphodiesterase family protein [Aeromicrobium yanjiei]MRJ77432.1 glycerophosphodiester phosphodiesterase [Aeromicrobium yanjiei]QGG41455.1 glycerophosphodiester phosphodiesterase [Aeromicrobium yanjiei]